MNAIDNFRDYMDFKGLSKQTVSRWLDAVKQFTDFIGKKDKYTADDVKRYLAHMRRSGVSGGYLRFIFYVLKDFYHANNFEWPFTKKDTPRYDLARRPYFTRDEVSKLLEAARELGIKEYAIVRLACVTGLRRIEIVNLNLEDYQPPNLRVKTAKHGRETFRVLDDETIRAINDYLKYRTEAGRRQHSLKKVQKHPALFLSSHRNPRRYSLIGLSALFKRVREKAGIDKQRAGIHALRRTFVTEAHKAGLSEKEIQEYGGWRSPFMPHVYIQLTPSEVSEKVMSVHPFLKGEIDARRKEEEEGTQNKDER